MVFPATEQDTNAVSDEVTAERMINTSLPITGGGDLSADRTIGHATSGVTPGSYTSANVTIDATGHVTVAANGPPGAGGTWQNVYDNGSPGGTLALTAADGGLIGNDATPSLGAADPYLKFTRGGTTLLELQSALLQLATAVKLGLGGTPSEQLHVVVGNVRIDAGFVRQTEIATPSAPSANNLVMFVRDNGLSSPNNRTEYCIIQPNGTVGVIYETDAA